LGTTQKTEFESSERIPETSLNDYGLTFIGRAKQVRYVDILIHAPPRQFPFRSHVVARHGL